MREFLKSAKAILEQPTAPFYEEAVRQEILSQLLSIDNVSVKLDAFGNIVAFYKNGTAKPRFAFAAHMDHPAYVGKDFLGGVPADYLKRKPKTRDFGDFQMWDLPAWEVKKGIIHSRACDDLIGCAAIVEMFRQLAAADAQCAVYGLFTRAEEVGFVGAVKLAKSGVLPKSVTVVSLETSSVKGGPVEIGKGVIIRVGDRSSVFDSGCTAEIIECAKEAKLPYQRALMQGGTCEATAYALHGYRTAAACVALGNYHNCGPDAKIEPEYVSAKDAYGMAQLCAALAKSPRRDPFAVLKARIEKSIKDYRKHF